jgi:ribosome-associated translation inhibitor RaiA
LIPVNAAVTERRRTCVAYQPTESELSMPAPVDIIFRNLDSSAAVSSRIRTLVKRLTRIYPNMTSCRVVVEALSRRHQHGNLYKVSVDVRVPNADLVVGQHSSSDPAHVDVYVAIRDAFDRMRRKLAAHAQQGQGRAQARAMPAVAVTGEAA